MINFRLIRHLWLFLAVAEEQNFSRAAKRLGMSQPPLTEQIQVLEQALKVKLFDRSRRGAKLTPVGQAILPAVRKFAEQLERLELAVHEAVAGQSGVLTIGAITTAMLDVLPALIEKLKTQYPQLTVSVREIDSVEAIPALEAGDIDLAFARVEGELGSSVRSIALTEDRLAVALPSDHPLAARSRISLASLAGEPLVLSSRKVSPMYFDNLIATCRASGFSPRVLHEVRSVASQIAFVSCGQGIALVPASLKKVAPSNVVLRPLSQRLNVVTTALAWNPTRTNPLVEELVAQFQGKGRVNVP
ncbi:LysR family transcriptional regulator [Pseudomonas chlororaphis]|uniref:LysR family transcriptional regulator n=1 Tax=Pseudomonas chlororaphis TaxID=587753 RepID=UPI000F46178D|nr:LysR family transcriptional regulator [Pseudomonas chlororaphis]ROL83400.1 LysR family transcriptional regulator [Pseudomonas chlororaphis]WDG52930.1 LysR family transcriptional regulator [Pseudomonas chlororaphis]WDH86048.1 LysR family transcriptional regulator [Pseudomonas chlororaphis]